MNKLLNKACFTDEAAYNGWRARNCSQCRKCVVFNEKLQRMPAFRCAIQRDIVLQHDKGMGVTIRTLDMVSQDVCPMLRPKAERAEQVSGAEAPVLSNCCQTAKECKAEAAPADRKGDGLSLGQKVGRAYEYIHTHKGMLDSLSDEKKYLSAVKHIFSPLLDEPVETTEDRLAHHHIKGIVDSKSYVDFVKFSDSDLTRLAEDGYLNVWFAGTSYAEKCASGKETVTPVHRTIRMRIGDAYAEILRNWEQYGKGRSADDFRKAIQKRFSPLLSLPVITEDDRAARLYIEQILAARTAQDMLKVIKTDTFKVVADGYEKWKKETETEVEVRTERHFESVLSDMERKSTFFIPPLTLDIALRYARQAKGLAAERRVSELRVLSRKLQDAMQWHEDNKKSRFDYQLSLMQKRVFDDFMKANARDLQILYITVNQECLRTNPGYPNQDIRCNAVIAKLFLDFLMDFGNEFCRKVAERTDTPMSPYVHSPQIDFIDSAMVAYAGSEDFNYKHPQVQLALKIVTNRIRRIDFSKFYIPQKQLQR